MHKYPTYAPRTEGANIILNSPPQASELSPIISGVNSASSASPMTYWANSQDPSAPYTSGSSMASTYATDQSFMGRHPYSPIAKEGFMSSHYNHHPFSNHMSISGSGESHQQQQSLHHQHHQHHINVASQPPPQALSHGPQHTPENYGHPPISSNHYLPSLSLQQSNAFSSYPSAHHSPQNLSETSSQLPPVGRHGSGHSTMAAPASYHRQYGGGFNLPAMNGPILSHMQAPDAQMSMTSNVNMTPYSQHLATAGGTRHQANFSPHSMRPRTGQKVQWCIVGAGRPSRVWVDRWDTSPTPLETGVSWVDAHKTQTTLSREGHVTPHFTKSIPHDEWTKNGPPMLRSIAGTFNIPYAKRQTAHGLRLSSPMNLYVMAISGMGRSQEVFEVELIARVDSADVRSILLD
ncbi:hypothetical protein K3495_g1215 [Podosphaera aphanis]|nr:hypothetical protein K3495_g1215 [Podosphaera aphanis]